MKHEEREQTQQTKLLQNNRNESSRGMKGEVQSRRDVVWRGVAPCGARHGMARQSVGRRSGRKDFGGVYAACVVVSGGGKGGSVCMLAAGSLGAVSNVAVAWRG